MITIFSGRQISLDGTHDEIYAQVAVTLRDTLHLFNTGKNLNPFAIFMKIALHADKEGWAWPGRKNIKQSTGLSTDSAITSALKHLCTMRIEGHRVMSMYRTKDDSGQWRATLYRIFPDAWQTFSVPEKFCGLQLAPQYENTTNPPVDNPLVDNPVIENPHKKYNHNKKETHLEGDNIGADAQNETSTDEVHGNENNNADQKVGSAELVDGPVEEPVLEVPGCAEPWDGPPPDAARVYQSHMNRWPRKTQYRRLHEVVGDDPEDLIFWGEVVAKYDALGWNPMNVGDENDGMLSWYLRGELPSVNKRKTTDEPASWAPLREWAEKKGVTWQPTQP